VLLVACFAAVVATVPLAGGRLGALSSVTIARGWTLSVALGLQAVIMWLLPEGAPALHALGHVASYGFVIAFLAANRAIPGLWIVALGTALNAAAIAANGGVMPAAPAAVKAAGLAQRGGGFANSAVVKDPELAWLGDVFAVPALFPLANVFSVGDVLIVAGVAVVLHALCGSRLAGRSRRPAEEGAGSRRDGFLTRTGG
jgi:hypothetical protein